MAILRNMTNVADNLGNFFIDFLMKIWYNIYIRESENDFVPHQGCDEANFLRKDWRNKNRK